LSKVHPIHFTAEWRLAILADLFKLCLTRSELSAGANNPKNQF